MSEIRAESFDRSGAGAWDAVQERIREIERDAAIANGYADKIVRFHAADVIRTRDHDSPYGRQRFIRMRVPGASGLG